MIKKLNKTNIQDIYEFVSKVKDKEEDFYITENKQRKFLKENFKLIEKILKYQEVYGKIEKDNIKAIFIIYKEKGFRPYLKILGETTEDSLDLIKFIKWNFSELEVYCKLKKYNPLTQKLQREGFFPIGSRGKEILLIKKSYKTNKIVAKDKGEEDGYNNRKDS